MNKKILYAVGGIAAGLLLLRACRSEPDVVVAQGGDPVAIQPAQPVIVNNSGQDGFLSGLVAGHLLGGGHSYGTHRTVVHHYTSTPRRYYTSRRSYSRPRAFRRRRR